MSYFKKKSNFKCVISALKTKFKKNLKIRHKRISKYNPQPN